MMVERGCEPPQLAGAGLLEPARMLLADVHALSASQEALDRSQCRSRQRRGQQQSEQHAATDQKAVGQQQAVQHSVDFSQRERDLHGVACRPIGHGEHLGVNAFDARGCEEAAAFALCDGKHGRADAQLWRAALGGECFSGGIDELEVARCAPESGAGRQPAAAGRRAGPRVAAFGERHPAFER